jgi:hypothetical protein
MEKNPVSNTEKHFGRLTDPYVWRQILSHSPGGWVCISTVWRGMDWLIMKVIL